MNKAVTAVTVFIFPREKFYSLRGVLPALHLCGTAQFQARGWVSGYLEKASIIICKRLGEGAGRLLISGVWQYGKLTGDVSLTSETMRKRNNSQDFFLRFEFKSGESN